MEEDFTALLADVLGGRRYWVQAPQPLKVADGAFVVLQVIDHPDAYTLRGRSALTQARVQLDVYAATYTAAKAGARALRTVLAGYKGGAFLGIFIDSERDLPASDAGDVKHLFRVSLDANVHHQET